MQKPRILSWLINRVRLLGKGRHLGNIRQAERTLDRLRAIAAEHPSVDAYRPRILGYLRKIDPSVFEEMLLTVVERSNVRVTRNLRYSGDGGIDGIFHHPAGEVLIQCKRYGAHIDNKHVIAFNQLVESRGAAWGLFVHTGRTGELSRLVTAGGRRVSFVSGELLAEALLGRRSLPDLVTKQIAALEPAAQRPAVAERV
ncbi:restriction system protein [Caballeronia udeis]|uniref:Restriction system protein n=1 Tax=Caballeronia udeis TaxID=1232866 RepID=A0ABW8MXK6_9BURK